MAYILSLEQMIDCLERNAPERAKAYTNAIAAVGAAMADEIAKAAGCSVGECNFDLGSFAAPFYAEDDLQPLPVILIGYDAQSEFGTKDEDNEL